MTVTELIEKLSGLPGHWQVAVEVLSDTQDGGLEEWHELALDVEPVQSHSGLAAMITIDPNPSDSYLAWQVKSEPPIFKMPK